MVETVYHSDEVFREAFAVFNSMREASEHTDIILRGDGDTDHDPGGIACHRLVLAAVSPYFRAMFRSEEPSSGQEIRIHGVEADTLNTIVKYCYTGIGTSTLCIVTLC